MMRRDERGSQQEAGGPCKALWHGVEAGMPALRARAYGGRLPAMNPYVPWPWRRSHHASRVLQSAGCDRASAQL